MRARPDGQIGARPSTAEALARFRSSTATEGPPNVLERLSPAIAANRFGLGARPGEMAQIGSQPRDWLRAQLSGAPPLLTGAELHSSAETLARGLDVRRELRAAKRAAAESSAAPD